MDPGHFSRASFLRLPFVQFLLHVWGQTVHYGKQLLIHVPPVPPISHLVPKQQPQGSRIQIRTPAKAPRSQPGSHSLAPTGAATQGRGKAPCGQATVLRNLQSDSKRGRWRRPAESARALKTGPGPGPPAGNVQAPPRSSGQRSELHHLPLLLMARALNKPTSLAQTGATRPQGPSGGRPDTPPESTPQDLLAGSRPGPPLPAPTTPRLFQKHPHPRLSTGGATWPLCGRVASIPTRPVLLPPPQAQLRSERYSTAHVRFPSGRRLQHEAHLPQASPGRVRMGPAGGGALHTGQREGDSPTPRGRSTDRCGETVTQKAGRSLGYMEWQPLPKAALPRHPPQDPFQRGWDEMHPTHPVCEP